MVFPRSLLVATAFLTWPLAADFDSALGDYQSRQFDKAFAEFHRLAELGDAPSQRSLAAMYNNGEHVEKNPIEAWAWAALAAEQDHAAHEVHDAIGLKLSQAELDQAKQRFLDLQEQFGVTALTQRLMPVPVDQEPDCSVDILSDAVPVKTSAPSYPMSAIRAGIEGSACATFYIDERGQPLRPLIHQSQAQKDGKPRPNYAEIFGKETLKALSSWQFIPAATTALREVPRRYCISYSLSDSGPTRTQTQAFNQQRDAALAGDPVAQYEIARQLELSSAKVELTSTERTELNEVSRTLLAKSAFSGYAKSQYQLAKNLLTGNQCQKDVGKGIAWLGFAAQQGHTESQYLLASRLLHGEGVQQDPVKAKTWLHAAADGGHARAKIEYALYLLRHEPSNAEAAMSYLPEIPAPNDMLELEATALYQAMRGDFQRAVTYQTEVVAIARDIGSTLSERELALNHYQSGKLPSFAAANDS